MIAITIISSISVNPPVARCSPRARRLAALFLRRFNPFISTPRHAGEPASHLHYQSLYFVPLSAVPVDFEYTSKTLFPPQVVESQSSLDDRSPQSARPVIGSIGTLRKKRSVLSFAPPICTPFTSVSKSAG